MDDILKSLGWDDGFRIPLANEENKALEMEVQKKQKEKENLKSTLDDINDKVSDMKKHLENVKHQFDQNQNLIFAHNNQKATEEDLAKLAKIEDNSLANEIKKIKKEERDVQERQNMVQMEINRVLQNIDKLNTTIQWDKDALLAWDEEACRTDEDTHMLEKFGREDESKFKELEMKRQTLGLELENKRNRLIALKNDVMSMEQSLDKSAQMFKRQHVDRRVLVQQWEASVRILHQRDEDINRVVEEIGNLRSLAKERLKDLEEQKTFFENEEKNNKEIERDIEIYNKQIADTKEKIRQVENILVEENNKLETLKTLLSSTTIQLHNELSKHKSIFKEIEMKSAQLDEMRIKMEKAKEEYEQSKNKTLSAVDRVYHLEKMLKDEEKIMEKNLVEFKKLDDLTFQVIQQIAELKAGEKDQSAQIGQIEARRASIRKHIAKCKMEMNRQQEVLYNMDFAYMEKDIQLNRMLGVVKEQDSEKHEKKIAELEQIHVTITATNTLLTKEVTRLEEDMRRITIDLQGDSREQNYLKNKRQEYVLLVECGQKQLDALRIQNQDKQVDENLLKLRVKQAEKAIDKVGGNVFSLEKQRLELEEAMKEREIEIKALRDILNVRRRVLNEQTANLNSKINMARLKVENLKNKFEVSVLKMGKDENGEPLSISYIKIKGAQEKFDLQEIGDKLDSKIKKTEKEILAMENTLKVVSATNRAFKNNLQSIDSNSPEQTEKEELEQIHTQVAEESGKKKSILQEMNLMTISLEQQLQEKIKMEESIIKMWREKDIHAAEIDSELKEQEEKLDRADKQLKKLIKEIRGTQIQKFQTIEEKDIELRELMEQNEYGLQQLAELVAKTYDIGPVVRRYLSEKGLSLPMIKSPVGSVKSSSRSSIVSPGRSSVSSKYSSISPNSCPSTCLINSSIINLNSSQLSGSISKTESSMTIGEDLRSMMKSSASILKKRKDSETKRKNGK